MSSSMGHYHYLLAHCEPSYPYVLDMSWQRADKASQTSAFREPLATYL